MIPFHNRGGALTIARRVCLVAVCAALLGADAPLRRATLDAHVAELAPLVEEVTGRRFEQLPQVRWARPRRLEREVRRELQDLLPHVLPDLGRVSIRGVASLTARLLRPGLVGKYALQTRTIHLQPKVLRERIPDPTLRDDIARLSLAHELAHALQDQEIGLQARMTATESYDAWTALQATLEGQAVQVAEAVAERLGLQDAFARSLRMHGGKDPPRNETLRLWTWYVQGHRFVEHHAAEPADAWALLEAPPRTTRELFDPRAYGEPAPDPVRRTIDPELRAHLRARTLISLDLGELDFRELLAGSRHLNALLPGFETGRQWTGTRGVGSVGVTVLRFERDNEAMAAYGVLEDRVRSDAVPLGATSSPVEGLEDTHFRLSMQVSTPSGAPVEQHRLGAVRGRHLVLVDLTQTRLDDASLARAVALAVGG